MRQRWRHRRRPLGRPRHPGRRAQRQAEGLRCWRRRRRVLVGVHATGKLDAEDADVVLAGALGQPLGQSLSRLLAGGVAVVGHEHPPDPQLREGPLVLLGEAVHPVGGGDVAEAVPPEGQGVDQRLAQDDLALMSSGLEAGEVEDAAVGAGQVEVERRALLEVLADLAAVELGHLACLIEDRDRRGSR